MRRFSFVAGSAKLYNRTSFGFFLNKGIILLFISFQVLVFFPALRNPSPWSDDWTYIYFSNDSNRNIIHDAISAGRPILGFLVQLAYQNDYVSRNPLVLQMVSLTGVLLLQFLVYLKLKKNAFVSPMLILVPLTMILIPGVQGYVYFLSCFPYAWACLLGFVSFDFINSRTPIWITIGSALFVVAFLIYPVGAMFYMLSYFLDFIVRFKQEKSFRSNVRNLLHILSILVACSAVSTFVSRAIRAKTNIEEALRIQLINSFESFADKVVWVFTRLFVSEFRVFTVASPTPTRAIIETGLVLLSFVFFILRPFNDLTLNRTLNFLLMLFLPLLGALPNLVILENQFEFRTLSATHIMSLILWTYCFQEILHRVSRIKRATKFFRQQYVDKLRCLICLPLVFFGVFQVQGDSRDLWVKPSLIRDNLTESALNKIKVDNSDPVCMVIPSKVNEPLNKLGIYSLRSDLASSWVPEPYLRLKLQSLNLNSERQISIVRDVNECDVSSIVINYTSLGMSS